MLFIWGMYNKFQYASSPQVESTPTEITTESQISSQSEEFIIPKITERQNNQSRSLAYDFPLNSCGDKDPGGANSWYPVYVMDTPENLNRIKFSYCRDAIPKYREEKGIQSIQVASFLNKKKAQEFANLMQEEIGSGEVGESSVDDFGNKSVVSSYKNYSSSYQRPSPKQFVKNYYVNLSYGNYQTTWNQLSTSFKRNTEGYSEYVNWWNSVREIRIGQIRLIEQNSYKALVSADLTYITNTGTYYNDPKNRIYLIWDSQSNTWLFENKF